MAVPANTVQRVTRVGVREDLSNVISMLAREDFPLMSNFGKGTTKAFDFDWQNDALAAVDTNNAVIDGDDVSNDAYSPTVRLKNYVQLMDKTVGLSHGVQQIDHAGPHVTMAAAMNKRSRELKRDMETAIGANQAAVPYAAGTAHKTSGAVAMVRTNASRGVGGAAGTLSGGAAGGYINAAQTNGTLRTITEPMLKAAHVAAWNEGGRPDMFIVSGTIKQTLSGFPGVAQQRRETGNKAVTIIGAADLYVGDFGTISFVPSVYTTGRDGLLLDSSLWKLKYLQDFRVDDLGKSGHSDKKMLSVHFGVYCENQLGNAIVADIQP